MICPIKTSETWKQLERLGPRAIVAYNSTNKASTINDSLLKELENRIRTNYPFYFKTYKNFLGNPSTMTVEQMAGVFYSRFDGLFPVLEGDIVKTIKGDFLLFPEVDSYAIIEEAASSVPERLKNRLESLQKTYKIPYVVINSPADKFAGRYVNQGEKKVVVINVAYATEDTPFHEYYHPFVPALEENYPQTFNLILNEAKKYNTKETDKYELVTEYLGKVAAKGKISLYLDYFLEFVRNVLGLTNKLTYMSSLKDILKALDSNELPLSPKVLSAYQVIDDITEMVGKKLQAGTKTVNYINDLSKSSAEYTTSDDSSYYSDGAGAKVAKRLTSVIGDPVDGEFSTRSKNWKYSPAEASARRIFKNNGVLTEGIDAKDITKTIRIGITQYTFQDILSLVEKEYDKTRVYGKMVHAFVQYLLERDTRKKEAAKLLAIQYAKDYGEDFVTLETHPNLSKIYNNIQSILEKSGVVMDIDGTKGIPMSKQDEVAPEAVLVSQDLVNKNNEKLGTTADGIFQHYNGDVTLIDWKTGDITKDRNTSRLMAFGDKFNINDSRLSKAHLELAFRAMMLKEKFPDMKFRSIKVVRVTSDGTAYPMEIELQPYLYTIAEYYKQTNPEVFTKLDSKGLFNAENYKGVASSLIEVMDTISHMTRKEQKLYIQTRLSEIHQGKSKAVIAKDPYLSKMSALYSDVLLEIDKEGGVDITVPTEDLNSLWSLKNFSDVNNPRVQTLHKLILEAKNKTQKYLAGNEEKIKVLYDAVLKESTSARSRKLDLVLGAANIYGLVTFSPLWFVGSILAHKYLSRQVNPSTRDHFAFMWRKSEDPARPGYYMNLKNTYTTKEGTEAPMSKAQIAYRDYLKETMRDEYNAFANKIVGVRKNGYTPIYNYESLGLPQELPEDFMPRVVKSVAEMREEERFSENWFGAKTVVKESVKRSLTSFLEDNYEDHTAGSGIPLRYFKHSGSSVVTDENHSWNAEQSFKFFLTSLKTKENLDPIYDIAIGVSNSLKDSENELGEPRYDNLIKWLDSEIALQITGNQNETEVSKNKLKIKAGALTQKLTGIPEGTNLIVSQDRLLRVLKTSVTYSVMSFKVWSPIRNALLISAGNMTQSTKGIVNRLMSRIVGVPPESLDTVNLGGARVAARDYFKAKMLGDEDKAKLWNIAKKFDWLPDNYPYRVDNSTLLSKPNTLGLTTNAFLFYQLGENFGALWQLAGLMQSIKVKNVKGEETTMWDAYNDQGDWTFGERGYIQGQDGNLIPLNELTTLEIKTMKRAYEKLNGSYRQEEKTAIEVTVLGDFLMQFHKYFYQYMKVLFASPYKDITVGKYVMTGQRPDGMPVYQWHSEVMEGQLKILVGSIFAAMSGNLKNYLNRNDFGPNTIQGHRARALASLANTFIWFALLLTLFKASLDEEEEESYIGKSVKRTIVDLTRGVAINDIFDTISKPVVAVDKITKTGIAMFDLLASPVTGNTDQQGWPQGLKTVARAIPGTAGSLQLADILSKDKENSDYIFGLIPSRWE